MEKSKDLILEITNQIPIKTKPTIP